jgi:putative DNA primase/helicase
VIDIHSIARALGGRQNGKGYLCRCPVPHHGKGNGDREPSLSISEGADGKILVKCHANCDSRDVLAELRRRRLIEPAQPISERRATKSPVPDDGAGEARRIASALRLWRGTAPMSGTLAEKYLIAERKLAVAGEDLSHVLRFHPRCPFKVDEVTEYAPALIGLIGHVLRNQARSR